MIFDGVGWGQEDQMKVRMVAAGGGWQRASWGAGAVGSGGPDGNGRRG